MKSCEACGLSEIEAKAHAMALGLLEEFRGGLYTCCQICAWAEEQCQAWFHALTADEQAVDSAISSAELSEEDAVLVPVRLRRQVPWYRCA